MGGCTEIWGGRTKNDPGNCVVDPTVCNSNQFCNMTTEACEWLTPPPTSDFMALPPVPTSFIFPGGLGSGLTYPRDTNYTIAAQGPATIYYTYDGTIPTPGASGTMSGASPLALGTVPGGTTIRWYADYGPQYAPEPIHLFTATTDSTYPDTFGFIPDAAKFDLSGGPVVVVPAGTQLTGTINFQAWQSDAAGYCPGCIIQYVAAVSTIGAVGCLNTVSGYGPYPGQSSTLSFSFTAPMQPGRYPLFTGFTLEFSCDGSVGGGPDSGEVIVQ